MEHECSWHFTNSCSSFLYWNDNQHQQLSNKLICLKMKVMNIEQWTLLSEFTNNYLCLTLSMRAAAMWLVLSPSCLLHVGQCSTLPLQGLHTMWPAGQQGIGRSRGMTRHTGHSTTDSRSPPTGPGAGHDIADVTVDTGAGSELE